MHEGSITTQIVESISREATRRKAKKVTEVKLTIGELTFLNPEQVKFWYEVLTKDTIMAGSKLIVEEGKGKVRCLKCSYEGSFKYIEDTVLYTPMPTLQCPKCNSSVEIIGGKDCVIRSIKMII
ncbi:hydrogenase maturation nickel metallochaperone HypA [Candidatus Bathyarchaeota archaeon]|nr:hydrogenase maturation nickel metallochaperone HypA [Candidatus Bathyarchaeota archaeon]